MRMISDFSEAGYLIRARPQFAPAPSPGHVFFEQAVLEGEVGHNLLEGQRLRAQVLDLATAIGGKTVPRTVF